MPSDSDQHSTLFLGTPVPDWTPLSIPKGEVLEGRTCRLEKLSANKHAADLHIANATDEDGVIWNYLPYGPYADEKEYAVWVRSVESSSDPMFYAIIDLTTQKAVGIASYLRLKPVEGSIEVGHINYSPLLQTPLPQLRLCTS